MKLHPKFLNFKCKVESENKCKGVQVTCLAASQSIPSQFKPAVVGDRGPTGLLVLGDNRGYLSTSDFDFSTESRSTVKAFEEVQFVAIVEKHYPGEEERNRTDGTPIILPLNWRRKRETLLPPPVRVLAVGASLLDDGGLTTKIKAWKDEKLKYSSPWELDTRVHHNSPTAATALSVSPGATHITVGFADGTVLVYRWGSGLVAGNEGRQRGGLSSPFPQPVISVIKPEPNQERRGVSALLLIQASNPSPGDVRLFICYEEQTTTSTDDHGVMSCIVSGAETTQPVLLDERGCLDGCAAVDFGSRQLMIGRRDGVYFYSSEHRGGAVGFQGEKSVMGSLCGYILVGSKDPRSSRSAISVYDLKNKFVAYHALLPAGQYPIAIACAPLLRKNVVFILLSPGTLVKLKEKPMEMKLELLYRKNMYAVAISLTYAANWEPAAIMDIYRMYGDHLYRKCNYAGAMTQYLHTVSYLQPSYVIRRYLDAPRIPLLAEYLGRLHEAGLASSDHTTLLLSCYTKLKDVKHLDAFISNSLSATFDLETALRVLKGAGYCDHASTLAARHKAHDWYLRIQLEKPDPDYSTSLAYIGSLDAPQAEMYLRRYGKALVANLPEYTTGMLMALCTGKYQPSPVVIEEEEKEEGGVGVGEDIKSSSSPTKVKSKVEESKSGTAEKYQHVSRAEDFIHLYVDQPSWLRQFLQYMLKVTGGKLSEVVSDTLLELLLREWSALTGTPSSHPAAAAGGSSGGVITAATDRGGSDDNKAKASAATTERKQREEEIMSLLLNPRAKYDPDHALVLVQVMDFKPGQLCLYEKLRMSSLILEHYMATGDTRNMLRMCRLEGRKSLDLWVKVLGHFVSRAGAGSNERGWKYRQKLPEQGGGSGGGSEWDTVQELLSLIAEDHILPPLQVTEILCKRHDLPLRVALDFLSAWFREAMDDADKGVEELQELKTNAMQMRRQIAALKATASSSFSPELDLPTSLLFGQNFDINAVEGATNFNKDIKIGGGGGHGNQMNIQEQFYRDLEISTDSFSTLVECFGRSVFTSPLNELSSSS